MNYRIIGRTTGIIMLVEAVFMAPIMIYALFISEDPLPFVYSIFILLLIGFPLSRINPASGLFYAKNAFVTVVIAWVILSVFGALPYYFCGSFDNYLDCLFESVSGFSTTGGSLFSSIDHLPKTILLWRNCTVFWGGMGVLLFATAILPASKDRSHNLMRAETPGPTANKLVPKLNQSSKILYGIYFSLAIVHFVCLLLVGIDAFDALNIAISTTGTGGFAVINDGISAYDNTAAELIISTFMLLSSINYIAYFFLITGRFKDLFKLSELRFYLLFILIAVLLIAANIYSLYGNIWTSLKYSFFTVTAFASTTGYNVVDHNAWPMFSKAMIFVLIMIGGCAGSTAGGMKISRVAIVLKSILREVKQIVHPRSVNVVWMDGNVIDEKTLTSVTRFFAAYIMITITAIVFVSLDNYDFSTTFSAVVTCMSNSAPGFGLIGPTGSFDVFSSFNKVVLMLCMLIGRLEIFPILIFLSPSTWKKA